jgi:hypothetical protein
MVRLQDHTRVRLSSDLKICLGESSSILSEITLIMCLCTSNVAMRMSRNQKIGTPVPSLG